jgi:hypothetical protein
MPEHDPTIRPLHMRDYVQLLVELEKILPPEEQ